MTIIEPGTLILLSHGDYSDYRISALLRVTSKFDQAKIIKQFRNEYTVPEDDKDWKREPCPKDFENWLMDQSFIEVLDCHEWHTGTHSGFCPQIWPKK